MLMFSRVTIVASMLLMISACSTPKQPVVNVEVIPIEIHQNITTKKDLLMLDKYLNEFEGKGLLSADANPDSWRYKISLHGLLLVEVKYYAEDGMTYNYLIGRGGKYNILDFDFDGSVVERLGAHKLWND